VWGAYQGAPYEGAFASRVLGQNLETLAPFASALAGPLALRAGPGGLLQGRFGFADPATGLVINSGTGNMPFGVVVPLQSTNNANGAVIGGPARFGGPQARWTWQTYDRAAKAWRMREGIVATLIPTGAFFLKFAGGANYGDTVYASLTDGSAISGAASGAVATAFKVCQPGAPGCLSVVSSTARFN
jgi:hypothetical protein